MYRKKVTIIDVSGAYLNAIMNDEIFMALNKDISELLGNIAVKEINLFQENKSTIYLIENDQSISKISVFVRESKMEIFK